MREYFIPFGKRVENTQRTRNESRVLVGRDGLRAYLINHLNITGPRTSILITGRRGTGKSVFVDHCLREHKAAVVERFLISQQGRPFFGVALLLILALLVPIALVFASGLLEVLVPLASENIALYALILPLFVICLSPALYALTVLRHLTKAILGKNAHGSLMAVILAGLILSVLIFLSPILAAPVLFIGTSIIGVVILVVFSIFFLCLRRDEDELSIFLNKKQLLCLTPLFCFSLFVFLPYLNIYKQSFQYSIYICEGILSTYLIIKTTSGKWFENPDEITIEPYIRGFLLTVALFLVGFCFNGILFQFNLLSGTESLESSNILVPTSITLLISVVLSAGFLFFLNDNSNVIEEENHLFRSTSLLLIKAVILLGIAYQLTYPLHPSHMGLRSQSSENCEVDFEQSTVTIRHTNTLSCSQVKSDLPKNWKISPINSAQKTESDSTEKTAKLVLIKASEKNMKLADALAKQSSFPFADLNKLEEFARSIINFEHYGHTIPITALGHNDKNPKIREVIFFPTLFSEPLEDGYFIIFLFFAIVIFYFFEFEWIVRPTLQKSATRVIYPFTGRSPPSKFDKNEKKRLNVYELERKYRDELASARHWQSATLVLPVLRNWAPSLVIKVNLGFERLNHESVTQSMLKGLGDAYKRQFLDRSSVYFAVSAFFSIFFLLTALDLSSKKFFTIPNITSYATENLGVGDEPCDLLQEMSNTAEPKEKSAESEGKIGLLNVYSADTPSDSSDFLLSTCKFLPGLANRTLPFLYVPIIHIPISEDSFPRLTVFSILNQNTTPPPQFYGIEAKNNTAIPRKDLSFRVYHLVTLIILASLTKLFFGNISPFQPYRSVYKRINNAYRSMTTERVERKRSLLPFGKNFAALTGMEREQTFSEGKRDPRSVELTLMMILNDIHSPRFSIPFGGKFARAVPWPEVTFIFDELDKVSGLMGPDLTNTAVTDDELRNLDAERKRAYALRELLSDMKRIISSAPARFIFVGNRLLHDEIVADRTRREAHLSSIFEREIYLPSLLTDHRGIDLGDYPRITRWDFRVQEYLLRNFHAAKNSLTRHVQNRERPFFALKSNRPVGADFDVSEIMIFDQANSNSKPQDKPDIEYPEAMAVTQVIDKSVSQDKRDRSFKVWSRDTLNQGVLEEVSKEYSNYIFQTLTGYLAFRSAGNPKKLEQLMRELLRLTDRAINRETFHSNRNISAKSTNSSSTHISDVDSIKLPQNELFRLELINYLYRHVARSYDETAVGKDDKAAVAILYLFEFLLKFHQRAFSWSSLERVDELAHVHRSPDLRKWLSDLVGISSERFMHRVLNGQYIYRFQGELAAELRYASRLNEVDQEAFNFTLDESQNLKASYKLALKQSKASNEDIIFGLGELHEYDKEFESARHHYRHCIRLVDETLFYHTGREAVDRTSVEEFLKTLNSHSFSGGNSHNDQVYLRLTDLTSPTLTQVMNIGTSKDILSSYLPWVRKRIRLMLHIAMTEELTRNLSGALVHYQNANRLALQSIQSLLATNEKDLTHALKNLNVLFQPMFAAAWAAEKLPGGGDTGVSIIERGLRVLRAPDTGLPFYRDLNLTKNQGTILKAMANLTTKSGDTMPYANRNLASERLEVLDSNFALIASELHNKAGDLNFLKGRGLLPINLLIKLTNSGTPGDTKTRPGVYFRNEGSGYEGHSFKAHYHYSIGLHQIRRYLFHRQTASRFMLNHLNSWSQGKSLGQSVIYKKLMTNSSDYKLNDNSKTDVPTLRTIGSLNWPVYVREGIFNNLIDLADTCIARVSLVQCTAELNVINEDIRNASKFPLLHFVLTTENGGQLNISRKVETFFNAIEQWFELSDEDTRFSATETIDELSLIKDNLGAWREMLKKGEKSPQKIDDLIVFGGVSRSIDRILAGIFFGLSGARTLEHASKSQSAAREYLRLANVIRAILDKFSMIYEVSAEQGANETDQIRLKKPSLAHQRYFSILKDFAEYALCRFYDLSLRNRGEISKSSPTSKMAITTWSALILVSQRLGIINEETALSESYKLRFKKLLAAMDLTNFLEKPYDLLEEIEKRHPFPAGNRLQSYQARLLDRIFHSDKENLDELKTDIKTWFRLHKDYDSEVYNSPGVVGSILAYWILAHSPETQKKLNRQVSQAIKHLDHAQLLISGEISNPVYTEKHYLYDDFNDRQLHSAAAVQMMSADLVVILREKLRQIE